MIEDRLLIWKFKSGSKDALRRMYEKYRGYLLELATALLHDTNSAEDVVHDVFLRFVQSGDRIKAVGNLKGYLRTSVVNEVRNRIRSKQLRPSVSLLSISPLAGDSENPEHWVTCRDESRRITHALSQLPCEQREVVVLHLIGDMKFRQIARLQDASIKTTQSRYRYGLDKLRPLLNSEVEI